MSSLVNIAAAGKEPFYVVAQDITAIVVDTEGTTTVMTAKGRLPACRHLDISALRATLEQSGQALLTVATNRHLDQPSATYISTAAITFATISQPDTNGTIGAVIGVKGLGWINQDLAQDEWADILSAMQNNGRHLLSFDPDQAHARWTTPQGLYIYPDAITQMTADGDPKQLNVGFEGSGRLDVQVSTYTKRKEREQALYQSWAEQQPAGSLTNDFAQKAQASVRAHVDCELRVVRSNFAYQLAQANGTLITVQDGTTYGPIYLSRKHIGGLSFGSPTGNNGEYTLMITAASHQTGMSVVAYFNERAQRDAAFDALQRQLAAPVNMPRCAKPGPK